MTKLVLWSSSTGDIPANLAFTNNFAATTDPGTGNDSTQGYTPGSVWLNVTAKRAWICISNAAGAAAWVDVTEGAPPAATGITAGTTRTQAGATALTAIINRVDTSTAPSAGTILGDGVRLAASAPGWLAIINNTNNVIQSYGNGSDTINGVAGATGIPLPPNSVNLFFCGAAGSWQADVGIGYADGGLPTQLAADGISAAGNNQATATQLAAVINTVSTVGAGQGVNLPGSFPGLDVTVISTGANALLVYPKQGATDTINGVAATVGVLILPGTTAVFNCTATGAWTVMPATTKNAAYNANNSAVGFTATAANVTGGAAFVELDLTGNPAGAANVQLPTVATMVAAMHAPVIGSSFVLRVKNSANTGVWTVTTNTGWTLAGTVTVNGSGTTAQWRDFIVTLTSLSAATLQNLGSGLL